MSRSRSHSILFGFLGLALLVCVPLRHERLATAWQDNVAARTLTNTVLPSLTQPPTFWDLGKEPIKIPTLHTSGLNLAALRALGMADLDSAESLLALAPASDTSQLCFLRGVVAERQGQPEQAIAYWADAGAGYSLVLHGNLLRQRAQYDEAVASYLSAADVLTMMEADAKTIAEAFGGAGRVYREHLTQPEQAVLQYERAATLHPQNAHYQAQLGLLLSELQRQLDAIFHLEQAVALNPRRPEYHVWLGESYAALGATEKARTAFLSAQILGDVAWQARASQALAQLLRGEGQLQDALAATEEAVRLAPDVIDYHVLRAETRADLGQVAAAIGGLQNIIEQTPESDLDTLYYAMGQLQMRAAAYEQAANAFAAVATYAPDNHDARLLAAEAYTTAGQPAAAVAILSAGLELYPDQPALTAARAQLLTIPTTSE